MSKQDRDDFWGGFLVAFFTAFVGGMVGFLITVPFWK